MDNRFNTIAGWVLGAGALGLGLTIVSSMYFGADKHHRPETMGYAIEGVEVESEDSGEVPFATLLASADLAKGEASFAKCKSCHTIESGGANGIGPNLHGVVGEGVGAGAGGFAFSDALKSVGGEWTFDKLNEWLTSPKAFAPGTKMTFAGLAKPEERANLIAWLNTQGSNLPLPEAPAAEEPAEDEATDAEAAEGEAVAEEVAEEPAAAEDAVVE
ncbi:c-type cytochrome [Novosphingobium mangrovi (ex Hu et al. 2023)]|uniref:C-type cytochrome n=1 Tax=Novosphingobium mangrovi (ex Hu et al. 2023) TaxID=2930094 RepID=A0ABT0ADY6_9SPHN|nr:c-type cytochrome [Novosphingobium mangrovi (ex Hu et al. 2023)]MCJ1961384.1 c-type cytochrome [Novosphingobium mangrovi (ex Hu et al. 2023)]